MTENSLMINSMEDVTGIAKVMMESGLFSDTKDLAQASVKVLAGRELGFDPFTSMSGINIIKNKVALGGNLVATLVKRHPDYNYIILETNNERCNLAFYEKDQKVGEFSFTLDDAKKAGLSGKDVWKKYPRNMLFYRALTSGVRLYCPDVTGGVVVYTAEEIGAESNEFGEVSSEFKKDLADKNTDEDKKAQLKSKQKEATTLYTLLHKRKDPRFEEIAKKYTPSMNPNRVKDISVLEELIEKLTDLVENEIVEAEVIEDVEVKETVEGEE